MARGKGGAGGGTKAAAAVGAGFLWHPPQEEEIRAKAMAPIPTATFCIYRL
jgi:hypothetical protein